VIFADLVPMPFGVAVNIAVSILLLFVSVLLQWIVIRWVVRNIASAGQPLPLTFAGSYWGLLGWTMLQYLSVLTIIGWAWVSTAAGRWVCRNVQGSRRAISFAASGWGVLWRSIAFALSCLLLIPIPWTLRWYARWMVSQIRLGSPAA
jgi:hypothetical protein